MIMHSQRLLICFSAICCLALSGCQTAKGTTGLFSRQPASSSVLTALQGGLVGRSGVQLGTSDKQRALEAEYRALEAGGVGQPVVWQGRSASGSVVAAAPYQVGSQNCRQYTHKLTVDGNNTETRGVACRNENGTWSPLG